MQKQAALNQISVVVPLRISQIHMFNTSGSLTGPTDKPATETGEDLETLQNIERLKDPAQRSLVTDIGLKTHTLFSSRLVIHLVIFSCSHLLGSSFLVIIRSFLLMMICFVHCFFPLSLQ